jgi:simple sugar transport system permease protein
VSVVALGIAVVVGMVFVLVSGYFVPVADCSSPFLVTPVGQFCYDPFTVFYFLVVGAVSSPFDLAITLQATSILVLTGLSVAVSFRAGLFNIGTQGQMVFGALASGIVGPWLVGQVTQGAVGGAVVIVGTVAMAGLVGAVYGAIPGILKAYADANEVITTIMLNIIASGIAFTVVSEYVNPGGNIQTEPLPSWAMLTPILAPAGSRFSLVVLVGALVGAAVLWYLLNYSPFGYDLRVSGLQPEAAAYSGVDARRVVVATMTLSGAFGGLAGAAFVLMAQGYWTDGLPAYGFDGITVSVLAINSPAGVVPAALLFGVLRAGTIGFQTSPFVSVPPQLADVLRGIIVLLVAMPEFVRMVGVRAGVGRLGDEPAVGPAGGEPDVETDGGTSVETDGGWSPSQSQSPSQSPDRSPGRAREPDDGPGHGGSSDVDVDADAGTGTDAVDDTDTDADPGADREVRHG